jgi:hypothetical protein
MKPWKSKTGLLADDSASSAVSAHWTMLFANMATLPRHVSVELAVMFSGVWVQALAYSRTFLGLPKTKRAKRRVKRLP